VSNYKKSTSPVKLASVAAKPAARAAKPAAGAEAAVAGRKPSAALPAASRLSPELEDVFELMLADIDLRLAKIGHDTAELLARYNLA
jgi:hypothetical protein